jgi:hypothetical protein
MRRLRFVALVGASLLAIGSAQAAAHAAHHDDGSVPAPANVVGLVTSVPARVLDEVGAGRVAGPPNFLVFRLHGRLERQGEPEVLSANLAWCPHCAADSWSLAIALSRFGTLTGLRVINTGSHFCQLAATCALTGFPCYPDTHGLSFIDAGYTSRYLSFAEVVFQDVNGDNLERPTPREKAALKQFDQMGQTPAVDIGGAYGFVNSGFDPGVIAHKTWTQIAGSLTKPHTPIAERVDGLANLFAAAFCKLTRGRPASVCKSRGVRAAGAAHLHQAAPVTPPPPPTP